MVAFARNISGITEIRAPQLECKHNKPKRHQQHRRQDPECTMSNREIKLRILILVAWLNNPVESLKLTDKELGGMQGKIGFYRRELKKRVEQANVPLSADALTSKFVQTAPRGRQNGIRVQHA